ncbi:hypothetical protein DMC63_37995 [Streptomyces sp. WAC 05977]|nr:hypothetical protein DMC63_37995 [Streptomyces sp. WAC 05977]
MTTPVSLPQAPKQRRRVRVALATLRRVRGQRERFATEYGKATTAQERFAAASTALRAAAADGAHQPDPDAVARRLDRITDAITTLLTELHEIQENQATKTLRADERRVERNERRSRDRTHPHPAHPDAGTTGPPA